MGIDGLHKGVDTTYLQGLTSTLDSIILDEEEEENMDSSNG